MDGLIDKYAELLESSEKKGYYLAKLYSEALETELTKQLIIAFSKLTKMYGWKRVLTAVLDIYDMSPDDKSNPYPLLVYFIKKRLEPTLKSDSQDLTKYALEMEKRIRELSEEKE